MLQPQLVIEVINILNKNNIEYMLTGSFVSSLQGEPRLTHDIDLIINVSQDEASKIISVFSKDIFYFDEDNIIHAIKDKTQFNIIAIDGSGKIDFWLLTDSEFDKSRFARRIKKRFFNMNIFVSTPEDTIIEKLYWSELSGGSQKQFTDALRVFEIQHDILDMEYINFWIEKLLLNNIFIKLKKEAENILENTQGILNGKLEFVIHKHYASRLHFDLRLELDGVLKSWAIPKGPTINPKEKRLAVMVEDHPLEYKEFEGSIPDGNYGAGQVYIWDRGTYHALGIEDKEKSSEALREEIEKGHLTFILEGNFLKGEFALVRLKKGSPKDWLFIKKNDEFASDIDISIVKAPAEDKKNANDV